MKSKLETMCLFFPDEMKEIDFSNAIASGVRRYQMFLNIAYNRRAQLQWMAARGFAVIFRLDEPGRYNAVEKAASYYTPAGRADIIRKLGEIRASVPGLIIEAVIVGNEPEIEYTLTRGSDNWGDKPEPLWPAGRVWEHQAAFASMRDLLRGIGVKACSPGFSHRRVRPRQKPQPGRMMWGRICTLEYNKADYGGAHDYADGYSGPEDENRFLWAIGADLERVHISVWINEVGVDSSPNPVTRMRSIIAMYDLLRSAPEEHWGDVITSFCPFVSNGLPGQQWSHMIMQDPQCYRELGPWMAA